LTVNTAQHTGVKSPTTDRLSIRDGSRRSNSV